MHACYILQSTIGDTTYNGYTNNICRRIRQHNGEIKGGARGTKGRQWKYIAIVTSLEPSFDKSSALSLEWHIRYPTGKKPRPPEYKGALGRLKSLPLVFGKEAFKNKKFNVYVAESMLEYTKNVFAGSVTVSVNLLNLTQLQTSQGSSVDLRYCLL